MSRTFRILLLFVAGSLAACSRSELQAETDAWHRGRLERLTAEDGWLTLVERRWLEEGESLAGASPEAIVKLPPGAPERLGTFIRQGSAVGFEPAAGITVTLDAKVFPGGVLRSDADGRPDVLRYGTLQLLIIRRGNKLGVRVRDASSPRRQDFDGIDRFPAKAEYRKGARFEVAAPGATLQVPNVLGEVEDAPLAGAAVFEHEGRQLRLAGLLEKDGAKELLFFVFADETNGKETYGGGRFLYAEGPKDGRVTLDFNRAFNPPCSFTPYATCPRPPKQNRLPVRIEAGEKAYAH